MHNHNNTMPHSNGHTTPKHHQNTGVYRQPSELKQPSESYSMGPNTGNLMPPHGVPFQGQGNLNICHFLSTHILFPFRLGLFTFNCRVLYTINFNFSFEFFEVAQVHVIHREMAALDGALIFFFSCLIC